MAFSIDKFRSTGLVSGGYRPSLFSIQWADATPLTIGEDDQPNPDKGFSSDDSLLVKAGSIPSSNIAALPISYGGRAYKLQGFRTFDTWTTTIIADENFKIRKNILGWMTKISGGMDGTRTSSNWAWGGTATVKQFTKTGATLGTYKFFNLWPTELAEIPLAWDSDAIEEYTITWCYDYWTHGTAAKTGDIVPTGTLT